MPNSLKCKIKHLCHNGTITERERDRILKALEQEPCDDCISRQAVIDALCDTCELYHRNGEQTCLSKCESYHFLATLPSVNPQEPKWIPVSERLPKSDGVYIVTREFTDGFECVDLADACYFDGTSIWHNDNRINHDREYVDKKIKAWMPLPEPYKAESEE